MVSQGFVWTKTVHFFSPAVVLCGFATAPFASAQEPTFETDPLGFGDPRGETSEGFDWQHDLRRGYQDFVYRASLPLHLALSAVALGLTIVGAALGRAKPAFILLAAVNAMAFVPFALFILFSIAGGSPVAQMSNYEMWSMWFDAWPLLLVWVGSAGVIGSGLALWEVVERSVVGPPDHLPLSIAMAVATPLNCFFAWQVLFLIAPDA